MLAVLLSGCEQSGAKDWFGTAGHESWVLSVACHPSGSSFATGSSDAKVKLWDLQTRTCSQTLADHTDQVFLQTGHAFFRHVRPCDAPLY